MSKTIKQPLSFSFKFQCSIVIFTSHLSHPPSLLKCYVVKTLPLRKFILYRTQNTLNIYIFAGYARKAPAPNSLEIFLWLQFIQHPIDCWEKKSGKFLSCLFICLSNRIVVTPGIMILQFMLIVFSIHKAQSLPDVIRIGKYWFWWCI